MMNPPPNNDAPSGALPNAPATAAPEFPATGAVGGGAIPGAPPDVFGGGAPSPGAGGATLPAPPGAYSTARAAGGAALEVVGFVSRLFYFLAAPALLYLLSTIYPMLGAMVNMILVVTYFMLNPVLRPQIEKRKWVGRVLKKFLKFEAYYRENPPRLFVYYVFYPLLFPYWIFVKRGREEFKLFRGLSIVALVLMLALALLQYFTKWLPIGFGTFLVLYGMVFLMQGLFVLMLIMPIATTVISYQMAGKKKRLWLLLAAMIASSALAIVGNALRRHDRVPALTAVRIQLKAGLSAQEAKEHQEQNPKVGLVMVEALKAAYLEVAKKAEGAADVKTDVQGGAELLGPALDAAREKLTEFFKRDEADAFNLAVVADAKYWRVLVVYAVDSGGKPILWQGAELRTGKPVFDLTPEALEVLKKIAKK